MLLPAIRLGTIIATVALLALNQCKAGKVRYKSMIRMERFGNCPNMALPECHFNYSEIVPYDRTYVARATYIVPHAYARLLKAQARISKCEDRNDPNCELWQNWRFGEETCKLVTMKNAIWTPTFTFHPPMSCPIQPGVYQMENVTLDIDKLKLIRFPEKGYWKVHLLIDSDKVPKMACFNIEFSFIKVRDN